MNNDQRIVAPSLGYVQATAGETEGCLLIMACGDGFDYSMLSLHHPQLLNMDVPR